MSQTKISSKIYPLIKAVASAAVLPVLFIYIMIAKPDYHFMNALSHVVVPTAQWIGDIITWPFRAVVNSVENIAELSNLRAENEELRAALDSALINKNACEVAILENKKLKRELNIVSTQPRDAVIADVVFDNSALGHIVAPQHMQSSWTRNQTHVPCPGRQIPIHRPNREVPV